jgi:hypothetical protein
MKTQFLILIFILSLFSCKDEVNQGSINKDIVKEANQLILEVTLKTSQAGNFKFFANNIFLNNNKEMNISITHKLKSNPDFEKITFKFPENINPDSQLGLSLGSKSEKSIEIANMLLTFGETKFKIIPETIKDYMVLNKFINIDSITSKIVTKKVDNGHNPILFFRRKIIDSLQNTQ